MPCWKAQQGVENVRTLLEGKPESGDRGNNISVKHLQTSSICNHSYQEYHYKTLV